jgi:hypothetical protein
MWRKSCFKITIEIMKKCKACGIEKSLGEYYKQPSMKSGISNKCKTCAKAYSTEWIANNSEKVAGYYRYVPKVPQKTPTPKQPKQKTETMVQKAIAVHGDRFDYSQVDYVDAKTPVTIICKVHGAFSQLMYGHIKSSGCSKCARENCKRVQPISTEEFIKRVTKKHGDRYDYSNVVYVDANTPVKIICKTHGVFSQRPSNHTKGAGCSECAKEGSRIGAGIEPPNKLSHEDFIARSKEVHGDRYDYSKVDYKHTQANVIIICPDHGEFSQRANAHIRGKGCAACSMSLQTIACEEFIRRSQLTHGDRYDYSKVDYVAIGQQITIICKIHGEFNQTASAHSSGSNCPKCALASRTMSQGEFIKRATAQHGELYDYSKSVVIKATAKVIIVCKVHGEFEQMPASHIAGGKCPICRNPLLGMTPDELAEHADKKRQEAKETARENNKNLSPEARKRKYARERQRRRSDPVAMFTTRVRSLISSGIRRTGHPKTEKTEAILGCSMEVFYEFIESQFTDGIGWHNQGDWHYDHYFPVSCATTIEQVLALNHYTNFRPTLKGKNWEKRNHMPYTVCETTGEITPFFESDMEYIMANFERLDTMRLEIQSWNNFGCTFEEAVGY